MRATTGPSTPVSSPPTRRPRAWHRASCRTVDAKASSFSVPHMAASHRPTAVWLQRVATHPRANGSWPTQFGMEPTRPRLRGPCFFRHPGLAGQFRHSSSTARICTNGPGGGCLAEPMATVPRVLLPVRHARLPAAGPPLGDRFIQPHSLSRPCMRGGREGPGGRQAKHAELARITGQARPARPSVFSGTPKGPPSSGL